MVKFWFIYVSFSTHQYPLFLVSGPTLFGIDDGKAKKDQTNTPPSIHFTMIFNSFVMMTLFNEMNARKIHNQHNIFKGIFANPFFVGIWIGTLFSQVYLYITNF